MDVVTPAIIVAFGVQAVGVLSPGPTFALILGTAARRGRAAAVSAALGASAAAIFLALTTIAGLAALVTTVSEMVTVMRYVGAAYLLWLAYGAFRSAIAPRAEYTVEVPGRSLRRHAVAGFTLEAFNPKALLFWVAIASVADLAFAPWPVLLVFVAGTFLIALAAYLTYALLFSLDVTRRVFDRSRRWIEGALGAFFTYAAFRLATDRS